jgi:hypothetical protein
VRKASPVVSGDQDWKWHEVTAPVPDEAEFIQFSLTLTGTGRVALSECLINVPGMPGRDGLARGARVRVALRCTGAGPVFPMCDDQENKARACPGYVRG